MNPRATKEGEEGERGRKRGEISKSRTKFETRRDERELTGITRQEVLRPNLSSSSILNLPNLYPNGVRSLQHLPRHPPANQLHRRRVLLHLIDGEHSIADELCL